MATINTTFGFRDQITQNLQQLNNALAGLDSTLKSMQGQMSAANNAIDKVSQSSKKAAKGVGGISAKLVNFSMAKQAFDTVKGAVDSLGQSVAECSSLYNFQIEQETKLETVMKNHLHANEQQIQSIKDLASEQQKIGIYGDEMQMAGLQELATYVEDAETLKELAPVLNSMLAQGVGTNATARDMQSYATMLGKVMQGQVGGMSKRGYKFSDEEEQILKTGTEMQRLKVLQEAVIGNFGDMNQALAQTPQGQIMQLNNTFGDLKEEIGKALIPFTQFFSLSTMNWKIKFMETLVKALNFIVEHINKVVIALGALSAALVTAGIGFMILKRQAIASAIAASAPFLIMIGIILLVTAVIGALLMFSEKTFPAIGGFIGGIAGIAEETGAQIKYWFGFAIEAVVNGFLKMKQKVTSTFLTMFDLLLSGVEKVASAMDAVFGTSMADGIQGFRNTLQEFKNTPAPKFSLGWSDDRIGFGNAWDAGKMNGAIAGEMLSRKMNAQIDKVTGMFKKETDVLKGGGAGGMAEQFKFDSSGALRTHDTSLDIADDYKELLSARARERFNLKFSQITPQLNIEKVEVKGSEDLLSQTLDALEKGLGEYADANSYRGIA